MNTQNHFSQLSSLSDDGYLASIQTNQLGEVVVVLANHHTHQSIIIPLENLGKVIKILQNMKKAFKVPTERSERYDAIRQKYPKAYTRWLPEDEERLQYEFSNGKSIRQLSAILERNPRAIHSRLRTLGLIVELQDANDSRWNTSRDNSLIDSFAEGVLIEELAHRYKLTSREIEERLTKLAVL